MSLRSIRATKLRNHLHLPHPLARRLHRDPHVLAEAVEEFHQPPDRELAARVRNSAECNTPTSSGPSEARAGTHTPQSIERARRMGPRLRGDDRQLTPSPP